MSETAKPLPTQPPLQVRYFWWVSVAVVLCHVALLTYWRVINVISANELPQQYQGVERRAAFTSWTIGMLFWGGFVLLPAWLAAFRKRSWALVVFFIASFAVLFTRSLTIGAYMGMDAFVESLDQDVLQNPNAYVVTGILLAQMFLVFSSPAQRWLHNRG